MSSFQKEVYEKSYLNNMHYGLYSTGPLILSFISNEHMTYHIAMSELPIFKDIGLAYHTWHCLASVSNSNHLWEGTKGLACEKFSRLITKRPRKVGVQTNRTYILLSQRHIFYIRKISVITGRLWICCDLRENDSSSQLIQFSGLELYDQLPIQLVSCESTTL